MKQNSRNSLLFLIFTILAGLFIIGCSNTPKNSVATPTNSTSINVTPAASTLRSDSIISLKYSSPQQDFEAPSMYGTFFCDYVEKNSDGRISVQRALKK